MYREDPWTHRYTTWVKGVWEDLDQHSMDDWTTYMNNHEYYRLRRVSRSWMVWDYSVGIPEANFSIIFHRRF